jgi:hypothetical protein
MIRSVSRALLLVLPMAAIVAGCGTPTTPSSNTTTTTTTTTSTTTYVSATETYDGSLTTGGSNVYTFHATPGVITVTLASLVDAATQQPPSLVPPLGLGLGTWDATTSVCTLVLQTTAANAGTVITGTASIESDFCVRIWDPAGFASGYTLNYQITAVHFKAAS